MISSMSRENTNEAASLHYDHGEATSAIEEINKELNELKDVLSKTIVKCHLVEIDLATQFNPHMFQTLKNAEQNCQRCSDKLELVFSKQNLLR